MANLQDSVPVGFSSLASGKRRSEIHAWTHSSVSSRRNWSEVTVFPSPAFLAKNQFALDGPDLDRLLYQHLLPCWTVHWWRKNYFVQLGPLKST